MGINGISYIFKNKIGYLRNLIPPNLGRNEEGLNRFMTLSCFSDNLPVTCPKEEEV